MEFVDKIHKQMFTTHKNKISIELPNYIKADDFMEYVNHYSTFKYIIENGVVTCELNPENPLDDTLYKRCYAHLKNNAKHIPELQKLMYPKVDKPNE